MRAAVSSSSAALPTRLRVRLATLALALFANAFAMSNPFPCEWLPLKPVSALATRRSADSSLLRGCTDAPFMVMSFGLTDDREAVGYYAGFVLSAFMLGRHAAWASSCVGLQPPLHGAAAFGRATSGSETTRSAATLHVNRLPPHATGWSRVTRSACSPIAWAGGR